MEARASFHGGLRFHEHIQPPLAEGTQGGRVSAVGRSGRVGLTQLRSGIFSPHRTF